MREPNRNYGKLPVFKREPLHSDQFELDDISRAGKRLGYSVIFTFTIVLIVGIGIESNWNLQSRNFESFSWLDLKSPATVLFFVDTIAIHLARRWTLRTPTISSSDKAKKDLKGGFLSLSFIISLAANNSSLVEFIGREGDANLFSVLIFFIASTVLFFVSMPGRVYVEEYVSNQVAFYNNGARGYSRW